MQAGVFFFVGGNGILNSNQHMQQWKEEAILCEIHMHNFESHCQQDFLVYRTRPVSVHLTMACAGCSFDTFPILKMMFSCIHFPIWPYPPEIMREKEDLISVNCMG